jgi:bifunctional DNA-binding transcriptional regulator/antitoxin component of YhaV-PrlF toxin-antitoxin module
MHNRRAAWETRPPFVIAASGQQRFSGAVVENSILTSTGQVTIPQSILERLGAREGDPVTFTPLPDGTVLMRIKTHSITDLAGILFEEGREPVPVEKLSL